MLCPPLGFPSLSRQIHSKCLPLDQTLKGLCLSGGLSQAVDLLFCNGSALDHRTYALLLQESINRKAFGLGRRIHAHMASVGFKLDLYLKTKLIILYAKNGHMESAHQLFVMTPERDIVSWNALISGYVQKGMQDVGLNLYYSLRLGGISPDQFTFASVLRACAALARLEHGKQVHAIMVKTPVRDNVVVNSALVDMYFKCSSPEDGRLAFDGSSERNTVTWTALISGYGLHGQVAGVLELFHRMMDEGFRPNYITYLAVLSACSHSGLIEKGWEYFHAMTSVHQIKPRGEHYAAMVDLLGRAGRLDEAYKFVESLSSKKHPVIWGALLGACRIHGNVALVKLVAEQFFKLDRRNAGKYTVLSNTYAGLGLWENVSDVREMIRNLGIKKDPSWSLIEVRGEVHKFLVRDGCHEESDKIHEMNKGLGCALLEAGYVPSAKSH